MRRNKRIQFWVMTLAALFSLVLVGQACQLWLLGEEAPECRSMDCLVVPDGFTWNIVQEVFIDLEFTDSTGEPLADEPVEVYLAIPLGSKGVPKGARRLFRGATTNEGRLRLPHRFESGVSHLTVRFSTAEENPLVHVDFAEIGAVREGRQTIARKIVR